MNASQHMLPILLRSDGRGLDKRHSPVVTVTNQGAAEVTRAWWSTSAYVHMSMHRKERLRLHLSN
jgi:hypothetical protein